MPLVPLARPGASMRNGFERTFPKPLSEHPGNIFVAGEEVVPVIACRMERALACRGLRRQTSRRGPGNGQD